MKLIISVANQGDVEKLNTLLRRLVAQLDKTFMKMLVETLKDRTDDNDTENVDMLTYILNFIQQCVLGSRLPTVAAAASRGPGGSQEAEFVKAGELLRSMLAEAAGDVAKLTSLAIANVQNRSIGAPFMAVLGDNISACSAAQYLNKLKILEYLKSVIEQEFSQGTVVSEHHHAPQFIDEKLHGTNVTALDLIVESPEAFIETGSALNYLLTDSALGPKGGNKSKKKLVRNAEKKQTLNLAQEISAHLESQRWAICDHFLPSDLVRRVRLEACLFQEHYEQAEIWVGKQADVGAQISVPSVRGDRVLWMCGGHTLEKAPEGVSRTVRTYGEIEPCRMDIKAAAPVRKFHALKELMTAVDKFVYELKNYCPSISGVFERTDAMLTIYPGNGSRFANHIDNTTGDGRRLTVIIYLNPEWDAKNGGALRITVGRTESTTDTSVSEISQAIEAAGESISVNKDDNRGGETGPTVGFLSGGGGTKKYVDHALDVFPYCGRAVMFFSSEIAHEVRPVHQERHAITFWYYDAEERRKAVEAARMAGRSEQASKSSVIAQREAKAFIENLMGRDERQATGATYEAGTLPTEIELSDLRNRVKLLSEDALKIVASITGAPSADSFKAGFEMLQVSDLQNMRALFRRMGLK
jgi:Rps23 Pro-64 3,4-dihydroxylase Tpa1-like proline 4-hydroxylase